MGLAASKQEAFWEACGFGHTERVKRFIEDGIDVNWVSYTHNSCAIHVASQGKPAIVKMLIEANCDVNVKDDRGNLAIHHAAMKGETECMQLLISAGSQINTPDKNGWTALINAAYWCQPDAVRLLIKRKCDITFQNKDDRSALHEACRSPAKNEEGLAEIAKELIQSGSDINSKSSDFGEADFTPLMFCSYHGHLGIAKHLIEADCDINAQGTNGWSALHWAANRNRRDMIEMLLKAGVDPLMVDQSGSLSIDRSSDNEIREILYQATVEARAARKLSREQCPENADKDTDTDSSMDGSISDLSEAGEEAAPGQDDHNPQITSDGSINLEQLSIKNQNKEGETTAEGSGDGVVLTESDINPQQTSSNGSGDPKSCNDNGENVSSLNCKVEVKPVDSERNVNFGPATECTPLQVTNNGSVSEDLQHSQTLEIPLRKTPGTTNLLSPADSGTDTTPTDPDGESVLDLETVPAKGALLSPTKSERSSGVESQDENDLDVIEAEG